MKLYTKTGDGGDTGLIGGKRVAKCDPRVGCYGDVDELNATIGLAAAACNDPTTINRFQAIQSDLFIIGTQLATADGQAPSHTIHRDRVTVLESWLDELAAEQPPLRNFVLPGGCELASRCHHARTVCRRAERAVVQLCHTAQLEGTIVIYLNRLSDLLFAVALAANRRAGTQDVIWKAP